MDVGSGRQCPPDPYMDVGWQGVQDNVAPFLPRCESTETIFCGKLGIVEYVLGVLKLGGRLRSEIYHNHSLADKI